MKVKLLKEYAGYKAGRTITISDSDAQKLDRAGIIKLRKDVIVKLEPAIMTSDANYKNKMLVTNKG